MAKHWEMRISDNCWWVDFSMKSKAQEPALQDWSQQKIKQKWKP